MHFGDCSTSWGADAYGVSVEKYIRPVLSNNRALDQDRNILLYKPQTHKTAPTVRIITKLCSLHQELRRIFNRHWHILVQDTYISKHIKDYREMVFHAPPSIRDKFTSSHYSYNHSHTTTPQGIYRCGKCDLCPWVNQGTQFRLPNGEHIKPDFYADCDTLGMVWYIADVGLSTSARLSNHL